MTVPEFYLLYATRVPKEPNDNPKRTLTDEEYNELSAMLDENQ
jgi:hypothetical protein